MPILQPKQGQTETEYIEACILDLENKGEGDSNEQRYAICKSIWEEQMNLPLYKLIIQENDEEGDWTGVDMVSLVDNPAMGYSYELFDEKEKKKATFSIQNEEKRLVSGVLMLADTPIYRVDEFGRQYYVVFEKETIRKIMQKFFKYNHHLTANFNHSEDTIVRDGVYFYESFQIDKERGIRSPEGYDLPDGSWFGTLKVEDDIIWETIKNGSFTGFSVEGMFQPEVEEDEIEKLLKELDDIINEIE